VIDWHHPQYEYKPALTQGMPHPLQEVDYPNGPRDHQLYLKYLHYQAEELMTRYGTIDIIWWDYSKGEAEGPFWGSDDLMAMVRKYQPQIVSNNRLYRTDAYVKSADEGLKAHRPEWGDFTTPEQHIPDTGIEGVDWEVCMTMNKTWGYSEHDENWKSDEELIRKLVDIASKGGNFLLNIGPKGDGSVPQPSVDAMAAIGRWMAVNSEAVYGTQASPFESPAWGRYTRKDGKLYAHVFEWPEDGTLVIPVKTSAISGAQLLADPSIELKIDADGDATRFLLPASAPDPVASVIKMAYQD
jgi:alpha-L-fucosidase